MSKTDKILDDLHSPLKNLMDELPFTEEEVVKKFNGSTSTT